jgi:hypothetical protein
MLLPNWPFFSVPTYCFIGISKQSDALFSPMENLQIMNYNLIYEWHPSYICSAALLCSEPMLVPRSTVGKSEIVTSHEYLKT